MRKVITWSTAAFNENRIKTNCLYYAENLIRYFKYQTPFNLKYCIAGEMRGYYNNAYRTIKPGQFILVNAGTELSCQPAQEGTKALHAFFTDQMVRDVAQVWMNDEKHILDDPGIKAGAVHFFEHVFREPQLITSQMEAIARHISVSASSREDMLPDVFYSLLEAMFLHQTNISRQISQVNARSQVTREELFRRVTTAREFMHDQWQSELCLKTVARQACLSPYHFHRSFQEIFGESPMKWLRQLKLNHAKNLLASGQMNATETAAHCGFTDLFSFSKAFKRVWGVNPSAVAGLKNACSEKCNF